ncbi:MAG: hypothetical protein JOZ10_00140 [Acidobacteria bacterium]|nr:hypothetical protein [Acidobacteriota bacterium]MBV9145859.1 hypothetical protein [Acidobacteriota bacterium]MBV9438073.1 hypothetical protein [Acidobacteriota bacterium]
MIKDSPQQELVNEMTPLFKRFLKGAELAPIEDVSEWDSLLKSQSPEELALLKELESFAQLWRYFQDRRERLGREIVNRISRIHRLSLQQRTICLREINRKLMERVCCAGSGPQFR